MFSVLGHQPGFPLPAQHLQGYSVSLGVFERCHFLQGRVGLFFCVVSLPVEIRGSSLRGHLWSASWQDLQLRSFIQSFGEKYLLRGCSLPSPDPSTTGHGETEHILWREGWGRQR